MAAAIELESLTKRYGTARGVEDIDLTVETGEVLGFLGPNGAGKSTTIRAILDLHRPTSGVVRVLGLDSRRDAVAIHRRTGYLSGDVALIDRLTGTHHLDFVQRIRGPIDRAWKAQLVDRLGVEMNRPVRELSRGNRQKVAIVLAFVHRPELAVLDEPTSGLDPLVQDEFHHFVSEIAATGTTVFLSSHSLDEVQKVAGRVALIREGRLVVTDTIAGLQRLAPHRMSITFADPVPAESFSALPGVRSASSVGARIELSVTGDPDAVMKEAARHHVVDIVAGPADLEELFLGYYRSDEHEVSA
jgi:beta-exotoxin I transport system ATP-binding protein